MVKEIEAAYRVVTPLFCSGVDPDSPELRLTSFKGMLRFWWRALAWSRYHGNLPRIKSCEDELFGSAGGGQSRVILRLLGSPVLDVVGKGSILTIKKNSEQVVGEGARYLGYGLMEAFASRRKGTQTGQLTRACFRAPLEFTVHLRCREIKSEDVELLCDALKALALVSGLGAKSRKGYGSLQLQSMKVDGEPRWAHPHSLVELADRIRELHKRDYGFDLPEYTAWFRGSRHVLLASQKHEPMELLDLVGREILRFRSWGHKGKILGSDVDSERLFKDDHDLMKSSQRSSHPRRIVFGLPHNYGRHANQQVDPAAPNLDRRASPLFIHLQECADEPVAVLSFFPARFLPKGRTDVSVGGHVVPLTSDDNLYEPIHDFLDRLLDSSRRKELFSEAVEVTP